MWTISSPRAGRVGRRRSTWPHGLFRATQAGARTRKVPTRAAAAEPTPAAPGVEQDPAWRAAGRHSLMTGRNQTESKIGTSRREALGRLDAACISTRGNRPSPVGWWVGCRRLSDCRPRLSSATHESVGLKSDANLSSPSSPRSPLVTRWSRQWPVITTSVVAVSSPCSSPEYPT